MALTLALTGPPAGASVLSEGERKDLTKLSLTELADIEVVSVSKRPERVGLVPAAAFVITREEIRRSGARTLADALRLAPGVHVARINANQWSVGIRGFGTRLSRSVLVVIDGRSVYSPLFGGTYWEVQDTLLEDVERIEVIRGPGGAIWGANAVNGVINIITRSAKETRGAYARASGGTEERLAGSARYGMGNDLASARVYGKYVDRGPEWHASGPPYDAWHIAQGGFRADFQPAAKSTITLSGDAYRSHAGQAVDVAFYAPPYDETLYQRAHLSGGNLLLRGDAHLPGGSTLSGHLFYDRTTRSEANFSEARDTVDGELRHVLALPGSQELAWGAGYRVSTGHGQGVESVSFTPATRRDKIFNIFMQDQIGLVKDRLGVVIGAKAEHNDYSGWELQPDLRILFTPAPSQTFWAAVSRAVRTPTATDVSLRLDVFASSQGPTFLRVLGSPSFRAEKVTAYEAGWRVQPITELWFDTAVFYNRYTDLLSLEPGTPFRERGINFIPLTEANELVGNVWGAEVAAEAHLTPYLRLGATYSYLRMDLHPTEQSRDTFQSAQEKASPQNQLGLHASMNLPFDLGIDAFFRFVDALPSQSVPAYSTLDLRLVWKPAEPLELGLTGQNLLQPHHAELGTGPNATELRRGVYAEAIVRF